MTNIKTNFSIYIHRTNTDCNNINLYRDTFNKILGADCVRSVEIVHKLDNNNIPFIRALIHFNFWPNNNIANSMYNDWMLDRHLDIIYNHKTQCFWRCCRERLATNSLYDTTLENSPLNLPVLKRTDTIKGFNKNKNKNTHIMRSVSDDEYEVDVLFKHTRDSMRNCDSDYEFDHMDINELSSTL